MALQLSSSLFDGLLSWGEPGILEIRHRSEIVVTLGIMSMPGKGASDL